MLALQQCAALVQRNDTVIPSNITRPYCNGTYTRVAGNASASGNTTVKCVPRNTTALPPVNCTGQLRISNTMYNGLFTNVPAIARVARLKQVRRKVRCLAINAYLAQIYEEPSCPTTTL